VVRAVQFLVITAGLGLVFVHACDQGKSDRISSQLPAFENRLEALRQNLKIPGLSAAIVLDTQIVWSKGFGYADIAGRIKAADTTSYLLASLTKTFAPTIIMQLVEKGEIYLDAPISEYGVSLDRAREAGMSLAGDDFIMVRHLLSHTAEFVPGTRYNYNGYLFSFLDSVIEEGSGNTFGELVIREIIKPLNLNHTVRTSAILQASN